MKVNDVIACSFPVWYEKFKKCTIKSHVLPLPQEIVQYLQDNGTLVLPEGSFPEYPINPRNNEEDSDKDIWDESDISQNTSMKPQFDDFSNKIKKVISSLGESAFPKLNWSSPKDASWISFNKTLQCTIPGDVYLLLKSSNFVAHDLKCPFKDCEDNSEAEVEYCLILRKWIDMNPSSEFRCFVKNKELIGICQRDSSQHYECVQSDNRNIVSDITTFWKEKINNYFPLSSYVFDVTRPSKDNVILLDFSPYGVTTDSLLFTWSELLMDKPFQVKDENNSCPTIMEEDEQQSDSIEQSVEYMNNLNINDSNRCREEITNDSICHSSYRKPEFRFISNETGVQPSPYMQYGIPVDIKDLATGTDSYKLIDFLKMQVRSQNGEDSSDSDDLPEEKSAEYC